MKDELNQLEKEFVEFMSVKNGRSYHEMEKLFFRTRREFRFRGSEYEDFTGRVIRHFQMYRDITDEVSAVEAYQFYSFMHLLRYLSYSYPKVTADYLHETIRLMKKGQFKEVFIFGKRKIFGKFKKLEPKDHSESISLAQTLTSQIESVPVVVDYGSGLGYISLEIGQREKQAKICLVDIECLVLEFAEYRIKENGIDVVAIPVNKDNLYPKLPKHNICIATEVMEHVCQPVLVYQNIYESMETGGILYGNFEDHDPGMFHVSPDLHELRDKVSENYEQIGPRTYKKN
ncbi:MAG: methyltransferase domain-containing protein [Planctomycetes bacterium]|nr:methyltransferase domain-containing protein [Planctomycetota bacterium]